MELYFRWWIMGIDNQGQGPGEGVYGELGEAQGTFGTTIKENPHEPDED